MSRAKVAKAQHDGPKRVALYTRVSTDEQALAGTSLEVQSERGAAYCTAQGWSAPTVYTDEGVSGAKASRPQFDLMLAAARAGKVDVLLVNSLDRAGRSLANMTALFSELDAMGVAFVSVKEHFDSSTPTGRLVRNVLAVFAEHERDTIRERTVSGSRKRVQQGYWSGGDLQPYGYKVVDGRLEPDPATAKVVKFIARRLAAGASTTDLCAELNAKGWLPRKSGEWTQSNLRSMVVKNAAVWGGKWTYGKSTDSPLTVELPNPVLPAVKAAELLDFVKETRMPRSANAVHPLTGRVTCKCGFAMTGFNPADRATNRRYICSNSRGQKYGHDLTKRCALPRIPGEALDALVWAELLPLLRNPSLLVERAEEAVASDAAALPAAEQALDAARRNLAETVARGVRLGLDDAAIVLLKAEAQTDFDAAAAARDSLLAATAGGTAAKRALKDAAALLAELMPSLEDPDELLMREVFAALEVKATVTGYDPLAAGVSGRLDFSALNGSARAGYSSERAPSPWR